MQLDKRHESMFTQDKLYIKKFEFTRDEIIGNTELSVRFIPKIEYGSESENSARITIEVSIYDSRDEEKLALSITVVGLFTLHQTDDVNYETIKKSLFEKSAITIMFPYIRSTVSLLTTQPDLQPIILPVYNIHKIIQDFNGEI